MTPARRPMATPRGRAWSTAPARPWWRDALVAVLLLLVLLACGIEDVRV